MKSKYYIFKIKDRVLFLSVFILFSFVFFSSCVDDEKDGGIVVSFPSITSHVENDPNYTAFTALIKATPLYDLLNTYGPYTCFVPNDTAFAHFFTPDNSISIEQKLQMLPGKTNDFIRDYSNSETDTIYKMLKNHIIKGEKDAKPLFSARFKAGSINEANLNQDFLLVTPVGSSYSVNDSAFILLLDKELHNGVIHKLNKVLGSPLTIDLLEERGIFKDYSIFYKALKETGLYIYIDTTSRQIPGYKYAGKIKSLLDYDHDLYETPRMAKVGYTVLMESDKVFKEELGINSVDEFDKLVDYANAVYGEALPSEENINSYPYTDPQSGLYKFVAYHIMNRMLDKNEFITPAMPTCVKFAEGSENRLWEYIEMLTGTLLEIQMIQETGDIVINLPKGETVNEKTVKIIDNIAHTGNSKFHSINNVLTYQGVENKIIKPKRIRIDVASLFPELSTNKLRMVFNEDLPPKYIIPSGYLRNIGITESTQAFYHAQTVWGNMYGDEFLLVGKYDFTLNTPILPEGRYEVRIGYTANKKRGVAQIYFDGDPCGIPLDMRVDSDDPRIGRVDDKPNDPNFNEEVDKMMRNRGYMKGPSSVLESHKNPLRGNKQSVRRIITTNSSPRGKHTIRIKSVEDNDTRQFHFDYMEIVYQEALENEDKE